MLDKGSRIKVFLRQDGRPLRVAKGFRKQVLAAPRESVQPKPEWGEEDYRVAADKKVRHAQHWASELAQWGGALRGVKVLEVGCGAGIDCLLTALHPVRCVVGIDMSFPLFDTADRGDRTRRLAREVLGRLNLRAGIAEVFERLPVRFATVDATSMAFSDNSFDCLRSRAVMEHVLPADRALREMARVLRPGGLMYHTIDPFYWLKGCHKTGLVDLPWAHARLSAADFHRFVSQTEGEAKAEERSRHLRTLNQFTLEQWRKTVEAGPFEILEWAEDRSEYAAAILQQYPEVEETLLDGVERRDLIHSRIKVWLRRREAG